MSSSTPLQAVDLSKKGGDFKATPEELKTIQERMKDPVFMDLLREYMQALEDPETRREEEAYLEQAEREAREGGDFSFEFIFPRPQFVVELCKPTSTILTTEERRKLGLARDTPENTRRCQGVRSFINVCASDKVEPCHEETTGDRMGSHWHVPVAVSQKRAEFFRPLPNSSSAAAAATPPSTSSAPSADVAAGETRQNGEPLCYVYDAVFHPDTLLLVERSNRFLCFLVEIAVEHINDGYKESNGFEFTRLPSAVSSIGQPQNQTVRTQGGRSPFAAQPDAPVSTHPQRPAETPARSGNASTVTAQASTSGSPLRSPEKEAEGPSASGTLPPHTIAHRGQLDLTEAWQWKVVDRRVGIPQTLVVKMTFEGIQGAAALDVSITDDGGAITVQKTPQQSRYEGLLVLPFTVEPTPVSAKLERHSGVLTLVLSVVPPPISAEADALRQEVVQRVSASPFHKNGEEGGVEQGTEADADAGKDEVAPQGQSVKETATHATEAKPTDAEVVEAPSSTAMIEEKEEEPMGVHAPAPTSMAARVNTSIPVEPTPQQTSAPVTDHIHDNERVQAMLAKVNEARRARKAAAHGDAPTEQQPEAVTSTEQAEATPAKATEDLVTELEPVEEQDGEIPFITKRDPHQEEAQAEEAALRARQEAWRQLVQEQLDAVAAAEAEELARTEEAAAREAAKTKKKAELAKQQEALELQAMEKMRSLPLANKHIFAIE